MSRIGNKPIVIPEGVLLELIEKRIRVSGKKGVLEQQILPEIEIDVDKNTLFVKGTDSSKRTNAFCGMTRSLINNMIIGSVTGFKKTLIV